MPANNRRTTSNRPAGRGRPTTARPRPAEPGFNFDTWQREEEVGPFPLVIGGKEYHSLDPMEIDYRDLSEVIDAAPEDMFRVLFPEDADEILANQLKVGAMVAFNEAIVVHFGLEDFIAAQS